MFRSFTVILLAFFSLLSATFAVAQTQENPAGDDRDGTIKTVQGDVTVVRHSKRMAAIVGGSVRSADRIQTGANSAAAITLKDGTVMSVGPDSVVDLSTFQYDTTTQEGTLLLDVLRGTMRMVTGLIAKVAPDRVKVTTPTTVIGVRGTDFVVEANP
jgi:hypothetical protein